MMNFSDVLSKVLAEKYPDDFVELGENWELIAQIFYDIGLSDGSNKEAKYRRMK